MDIQKIVIGAVAVLALAVGSLAAFRAPVPADNTQNFGALTGPAINSPWISIGGIPEWYSKGSCSTASSTIFAVQNPWSATSTVEYVSLVGTEGATTTDILVATSTTNAPATGLNSTSTLGANVINLAAITNGTNFSTLAGFTIGPGKGYASPKSIPGSTSVGEFMVGPSEYVLGFSTSTGSGNGGLASNQLSIPASCTYEIWWIRAN